MLYFIYFFKLSSAASWQLLPGQHKLYYLLSLAHHHKRIWNAVTKFIWRERERADCLKQVLQQR